MHQIRNHSRGVGVSIYIHKNVSFNIRKILESLSVEITSNTVRNTLFNVLYRPSNGLIDPFETFLKEIFSKTKNPNKMYHIANDFNFLDHESCKKVQGL